MDGGAWWGIDHWITKSRTQLSDNKYFHWLLSSLLCYCYKSPQMQWLKNVDILSHSLDWPLSVFASGFFQLELTCQLVVKRLLEESALKLIHIIGRIHFLLILGLRSLCPGWLSSGRHPLPSESLSPVLVHWPSISEPAALHENLIKLRISLSFPSLLSDFSQRRLSTLKG